MTDDGLDRVRDFVRDFVARGVPQAPVPTDDAGHWKHRAIKAEYENTARSAAAEEHAREKEFMRQQINELRQELAAALGEQP